MSVEKRRLDVKISEDLEREFRAEVYRRFGMKKGNLSIAVEEAIKDWIAKQRGRKRK